MKRILMLVMAIAVLAGACTPEPERGMEIQEAWMRPAAQGANGAVYLVLHNYSSEADELTGVTSDVAEAVEIHESQMSGDVMEMHPLETLPLEPDAEVKFEPGSFHIMLVNLQEDLAVGDEIEITLHFKTFEDLTVSVPVRDTPAPEGDHSLPGHE